MVTHREKQQQELYRKLEQLDKLAADINETAAHIGNETYIPSLRLYREQQEQIQDIQAYFEQVGMPPSNQNAEYILPLALKEFHRQLMHIKNDNPEE
ncbi:hypothetical protein [Salibacterium halotolerans]|uniref:Uncharacterized protein n=1 Tax=Salibacterium halotolerans TaxID=1884432 RepID=A0A1I5T8U0_9BACI|nr:hypothetical protein [Salibacterium halotolerans]SFP79368.1 hypothetical protein SAMN05518683_11056 [Salibacterium halotolerans]